MATATYSVDQVGLAWKEIDFAEGLAQGTSITETHNGPGNVVTSSANGKTGYSTYDPNETGQLSLLMNQSSATHQILLAAWNAFKDPDTRRDQFGTCVLQDNANGLKITYGGFHITKDPEEVRGVEEAVFTWVFNYTTREKTPNLDQVNIVG